MWWVQLLSDHTLLIVCVCLRLPVPDQVSVLWTGVDIISRTITCDHVDSLARVLKRKVTLWDNLHANDYDNGRRLYLGPYRCVVWPCCLCARVW